jgi:hypothetical protein
MNSDAVLDRETGLVWEKSPTSPPANWNITETFCNQKSIGNRKGWRVPTLQELASLVDAAPTNTGSPRLPPGHPFSLVQSAPYWSATGRLFQHPESAWYVDLSNGGVFATERSNIFYVWCVRGGQGVELQ